MSRLIYISIRLLTIICTITIIVLLFFSNALLKKDASEDIDTLLDRKVSITFDTNPLVVDNAGVSLMQGVKATDENGKDVTHLVNTAVAGEGKDKVIAYSVNGEGYGLETFERDLLLKKYKKPRITVRRTKYGCDINDLSEYLEVLIRSNMVSATDGFGNDISQQVYIDPTQTVQNTGEMEITLMVENKFADVAKNKVLIEITGVLENNFVQLVTDSVSVKLGNVISPVKYIDYAQDAEGDDISDRVVYDDSNVDYMTPGKYTIYYYLRDEYTNKIDEENPVATLNVVVTQ